MSRPTVATVCIWLLRIVGALATPISVALACRWRSRPQHQKQTYAGGDGTAVRLSAPGAVPHDVARQVAHVVLQIPDDVLDDVSDRDHAHDLARVQHWQMAKTAHSHQCHAAPPAD